MKPSIGRIIIVRSPQTRFNGTDIAPAVITRVHEANETAEGSALVNCTALPDCGAPVSLASISLFDTQAAADASNTAGSAAWWPERVGP